MKLLMEFKLNGWAQYTIEDFVTAMDVATK